MDKLIKEIEIELSEPISFHKGGEISTSNLLLIKAPTNMHRYKLLKLKQGFMSAMTEATAKSPKPSDSELKVVQDTSDSDNKSSVFDAATIKNILLMSSLDLEAYFKVLKDILCQDSCYIDGTIRMTDMLFESLSLEDSELVLGKYLESFLLTTWLGGN